MDSSKMDSVQIFTNLVQTGLKNIAPDIEYDAFTYADTDTLEDEINEFYNLAEKPLFYEAQKFFVRIFPEVKWREKSKNEKRNFIGSLVETLELINDPTTLNNYTPHAQAMLYLMQGAFFECQSTAEQLEEIRLTSKLVYDCGGLMPLVNGFTVGLEIMHKAKLANPEDWYDSVILYLTLLYYLIINNADDDSFALDLGHFTNRGKTLIVILFEYLKVFGEKNYEYFPLKKVLLLIWKTLLTILGGTETQKKMLDFARKQVSLPPVRREIYTKSSPEDIEKYELSIASKFYGLNPYFDEKQSHTASTSEALLNTLPKPIQEGIQTLRNNLYIPLSVEQIEKFEEEFMEKAGHVQPKASINQIPEEDDLDELNLLEDFKHPHHKILSEQEILQTRISFMTYIYKHLHQEVPRFLITFLKVLLATVPSVKKYNGTINLASELKGSNKSKKEMKNIYVESLQGSFETLRHKEIISKAISAIILLFLKHTKISHILQHEYISQVLVEANCILLILKFINQEMAAYCTQKNEIEDAKFLVQCMKKDSDSRVSGDPGEIPKGHICWRNVFSVINLLRILQKLTKNKPSRISVLIQYKAPGILKRVVKLPHGDLCYYSLKLLKSQLPTLGRKWQTTNMKIVSSILYDLRMRYSEINLLTESTEEDEDLQGDEKDYGVLIETYNQIYCHNSSSPLVGLELDNDLSKVELEKDFQENYQQWLEEEVFDDQNSSMRAPSPDIPDD